MKSLDMIKFVDGGTDFGPPMQNMRQCIQNSIDKYDRHIVCFMSDGWAAYPKDDLELIVKD